MEAGSPRPHPPPPNLALLPCPSLDSVWTASPPSIQRRFDILSPFMRELIPWLFLDGHSPVPLYQASQVCAFKVPMEPESSFPCNRMPDNTLEVVERFWSLEMDKVGRKLLPGQVCACGQPRRSFSSRILGVAGGEAAGSLLLPVLPSIPFILKHTKGDAVGQATFKKATGFLFQIKT